VHRRRWENKIRGQKKKKKEKHVAEQFEKKKKGYQFNQKLPTIEGPLKNEKKRKQTSKQINNRWTDETVLFI